MTSTSNSMKKITSIQKTERPNIILKNGEKKMEWITSKSFIPLWINDTVF